METEEKTQTTTQKALEDIIQYTTGLIVDDPRVNQYVQDQVDAVYKKEHRDPDTLDENEIYWGLQTHFLQDLLTRVAAGLRYQL